MNLIEISEQLKDVPDQLLMKEVQSPSGAYPSYLVVTEMTRRKRMRDQAMKEVPSTTVVQDLTQPSREQMMAAMAATQRGMAPSSQLVSPEALPPQAQQMSQPAPRLNAPGIMASQQAMNTLAAQDVMGAQEPRRMAGGGMVAFAEGGMPKYDDRGAIRFQNQGVVPRYTRFEDLPIYVAPERERVGPASSMGEFISNIGTGIYNTFSDISNIIPNSADMNRATGRDSGRDLVRIDPVTKEPISFGEFMRRQEREKADAAAPAARTIVENTLRTSPLAAGNFAIANPKDAAVMALKDPIFAQRLEEARSGQTQPQTSVVFKDASNPRTINAGTTTQSRGARQSNAGRAAAFTPNFEPIPPLSLTPYVDPYAAEAKQNVAAFRATREPTAKEIETERTAREIRYGEKVPFRMGFLEKEIDKRQKDIEGRRSSNINEALIQTGLGVMRSKSPRFLSALGEGGTEGLAAYRQGLKDIREGEKDILQSRVSFANAQTLYDQGKFNDSEKAEDKAYQRYERGIARLSTENAMIARAQNQSIQAAQLTQQGEVAKNTAALNQRKIEIEQQKLPLELDVLREQAGYYSRMPNAQGGRGLDITPSPSEIKTAQELARNSVMTDIISGKSNVKLMSKEFNQLVEQRTQEIIRISGKVYTPLQPVTTQAAPGQVTPSGATLQEGPDGVKNYVLPK